MGGTGHLPDMNYPILLADVALSGESPVSLSLAWTVGGAVVVLAIGLAESRFKISAQEKRLDAQEAAIGKAEEKASKALSEVRQEWNRDSGEIRAKVQVMEVGAAEAKVLMSEVRTQLTQYGEQNREQTRMLHDLLALATRREGRRGTDAP